MVLSRFCLGWVTFADINFDFGQWGFSNVGVWGIFAKTLAAGFSQLFDSEN